MTALATAPTDKELRKGPTVTLQRPGWDGHAVSPHGFAYNIVFHDGEATVLKAHVDAWITAGFLATNGVTIIDSEPSAPESPERSKVDLYDEATRLDIAGRSSMTKEQLAEAIEAHS